MNRIRNSSTFILFRGCSFTEQPIGSISIQTVKSVAASPQQVALLLAKPEHLEQGPEKTKSVSEGKILQAMDGQHLKECNLTGLLINAAKV